MQHPISFESVTKAIPEFFQPLFNELGIKPTWLLSPEVIKDGKCVEILKQTLENGAELGTHLHSEFIAPNSIEFPVDTHQRQNKLSSEMEFEKLKNLTHLFKTKFGYQPISFRAGRFSLGPNTLKHLEDLGYKIDSSVVPNKYVYDKDGSFGHNFLNYPRQPYFPDLYNSAKSGTMEILEVPVSSSFNFHDKIPAFVSKITQKRNTFSYGIQYLFKKDFNFFLLRPTGKTNIQTQRQLINDYLEHFDGPVYLVMMFHNVDFVPGMSPYAQTSDDQNNYVQTFRDTIAYLNNFDVHSITLSEIPNLIAINDK